ncbi:hypothetical protein LWI29_017796 [Acer saccharum]|uniref:Uncharacterized protein n=1 Tax=Acer saccharum TaxID=4024 RepID=A0AA39S0J7_ACESA|nr:hypothetical protein LWI29_017796 [Acer saccharum]
MENWFREGRGLCLFLKREKRFEVKELLESGSIASQNGESANAAVIGREVTTIGRTETLPPGREMNHPQSDRMAIDGPVSGLGPSTSTQSLILSESGRGSGSENMGSKQMEVCPGREVVAPNLVTQMQDPAVDHQLQKLEQQVTPVKKSGKKWKRAARSMNQTQIACKISSPLQRMIMAGKISKKEPKAQSPPRRASGKSPRKISPKTSALPPLHSPGSKSEGGSKACKRKVVFELSEVVRDSKKGKTSSPEVDPMRSAEPDIQARREQ